MIKISVRSDRHVYHPVFKVTVGEAENPRKNIPVAIRRTFWRILVFYVGGVFVIGLVVPSTDQSLFIATQSKTGAAASPFVVATTLVNFAVVLGS
jgi:amino acid transporter